MTSGRARAWLVTYPRAIPIALFIFIAAITLVSVFAIESNAQERKRGEVREYAQSIASALDRRGNSFSAYLRAGAALFSTVDEVTPQTFRQFVAELRLGQNYRGAEGIGWASAVSPNDTEQFLSRVRAHQPDFPTLDASAAAGRGVMAPVTMFSPDTSRNRRALGFDMYSEPARAAAMDEAKRTIMPVASGKIVLVQEGAGEAPGFVIFMPVYKPVPGSVEQERALAGFVFSSFDAGQFLDAAIERAPPTQLGVRLYDGASDGSNLLVSRSLGAAGTDRFEQPVTIANRDLMLVIDSAGAERLGALSMLTLIAGLAMASLLMLILRMLVKQTIEDQARLAFFEEQNSIRNSLSRELNHRVKNALANVLSILSLTRRRSNDLDSFADSLEGRIRALSATHDLLTVTDWGTTPIEAVIDAELGHFVDANGDANGGNVHTEGPPVQLAPNDALSFGLAIHELATNAAKYGALSAADGVVTVRWHRERDDLAIVEWTETGGPAVTKPTARGFGTELIEKVVAHELKHRVEIEFLPTGVRCAMGVPIRKRGDFQIRQAPEKSA
ncbi:CHASE domain-containing protein [Erythrobacter sp. Alg231-14]|uniref:CHASE domain-containing protein n=1 Tax=Erythrobacter sp. Alg231-14 TaxID=1922225 RepID=UPI00307C05D5